MQPKYLTSLAVFLFITWLLLSGHYNSLLICLGLGSVFFVLLIVRKMDVVDRESHPIHLNIFSLVTYWLWLLKEISVSNIIVAKYILSPGVNISPRVISVPSDQTTDLGKVIFANSITLTPGTLTMSVDEKTMEVHALLESSAEGLLQGEMNQRVTELENKQ